jgi:hypothetical protein
VDHVELDGALGRIEGSSDDVAGVALDGNRRSRLSRCLGQHPHELAHVVTVMDEQVAISGHPVSQIGAGKRGPTAQMAGNPLLAGSQEVEHRGRDHTPVEGAAHGSDLYRSEGFGGHSGFGNRRSQAHISRDRPR